jgi:hypothetical protein
LKLASDSSGASQTQKVEETNFIFSQLIQLILIQIVDSLAIELIKKSNKTKSARMWNGLAILEARLFPAWH